MFRLTRHLLVTCFLLGGCQPTVPSPVRLTGSTMGTHYSVLIAHPITDTRKLANSIEQLLARIDQQMSTYREDSELSRFNSAATIDWQPVSVELAMVVQQAQQVSRESAGRFDATVAPLVNLWGFGPDGQAETIPTKQQIDAVLVDVGFQHLDVQISPPAIKKARPALQLDLSAIAKGYAVDAICQLLEDAGLSDYLVEIGGELRAAGRRASDNPWMAGIEHPRLGGRPPMLTMALTNRALATSGDYRNNLVLDGQLFSHTIDSRSGYPVQHELTSVSVIADNCMLADAYATTLMATPLETAYDWAEEQQLAVCWIHRDGGELKTTMNRLFREQLTDHSEAGGLTGTLLIALLVFGLAMLGMAIGSILGRRRLQGSCGGLAGRTDEDGQTLCSLCETPPEDCPELRQSQESKEVDCE